MPSVSVIISHYDNASAFARCVWSLQAQRYTDFVVILADDGSQTNALQPSVDALAASNLRYAVLTQPKQGFGKTRILNQALKVADSEWVIFTDADMLLRDDWIANHVQLCQRYGAVTGGSHINIASEQQQALTPELVQSQQVFAYATLCPLLLAAMRSRKTQLRLTRQRALAAFADVLTYRRGAFSGASASCRLEHALAINGFDNTWGYGGLDMEFGIRLAHYGVTSHRCQHRLVALHQDHPRAYRDETQVQQRKRALKALKRNTAHIRSIDGVDEVAMQDIDCVAKC